MKRRRLVAIGAACLTFALGACAADEPPPFRKGAPGARAGGALRVGLTRPGSVDPGNVYEPSGDLIVRTMCVPLLAADPITSELLPSVVESWLVTDGGGGLTLRLRDDVRFSDGTPLTAEDVVFTLTRIASAEFASTSAELLSPILGYGEIHGDVPAEDPATRERLAGVAIRDEDTVQISLNRPQADFVRVLTSPVTSPVSERAARADPRGFGRNPICVGPYRLEEAFSPADQSLRLVRSKSFEPLDRSATRGGASYLDRIEFRFFPDASAATAAALAGEVDVAPAGATDSPRVRSAPGPELEYIGLPVTGPGFDQPVVRRALSMALDRAALVNQLFPATRRPATGFLPPTSPLRVDCKSSPAGPRIDAARALLAEAGVDLSQLRVPFYFNDEHRHRELVTEVASQWQRAFGMTATPAPLSFEDYVARGEGRPGFDGPFRFSWSVPFPDVDGYLFPLFATERIGRDNFTRLSEPDLDQALSRGARRAQEPADRELAYEEVARQLCESMPMIPLTATLSRWLVADHVRSAIEPYIDGATGQPLLRELYVL